jgi:hypothetical protein
LHVTTYRDQERRFNQQMAIRQLRRLEARREAQAALREKVKIGAARPEDYLRAGIVLRAFTGPLP